MSIHDCTHIDGKRLGILINISNGFGIVNGFHMILVLNNLNGHGSSISNFHECPLYCHPYRGILHVSLVNVGELL